MYVGQSINIQKRLKTHTWNTKNQKFYIHKAIHKYGVENFSFEVLLYAEGDEYLNFMEQKCIQSFNTFAPNGYNLDSGGLVNRNLSESTKEKMRGRKAWNKGVPMSDEQKEKMRKMDKSYTKTPEYRKMMSEAKKRSGISPEHREKINASQKLRAEKNRMKKGLI